MNSRRSMLIIVNPTAGRGRALRTAELVARRWQSCDRTVEVAQTTAAGDAERFAREAVAAEPGRFDCVVACGGDGTVQEVAQALAELRVTLGDACPVLGLAPAGRCNDFARALNVPTDADRIADILLTATARAMDLGRVNGRYFCTVVTTGIDAEISRYVDQASMWLSGTPAYLLGAMRVLKRYRPQRVRLQGDFGCIEQPVFLASAANTSSYGGAVPIAPHARPDDGVLDLCIIEGMTRLQALMLIPTILRGRHVGNARVRFVRTKGFTIDATEPCELWADGQYMTQTPATIEVAPAAVRVPCPARSDTPTNLSRGL
ncbi:MAG: diacylglycerol kinase family lipid kinase [Planctomycetes bacterium]|nr:diacylglycerol kinase family lipid kinase [Planctomycetota bacterium]